MKKWWKVANLWKLIIEIERPYIIYFYFSKHKYFHFFRISIIFITFQKSNRREVRWGVIWDVSGDLWEIDLSQNGPFLDGGNDLFGHFLIEKTAQNTRNWTHFHLICIVLIMGYLEVREVKVVQKRGQNWTKMTVPQVKRSIDHLTECLCVADVRFLTT